MSEYEVRTGAVKVKMTKEQLKKMFAESLWQGVLASSQIEGINTDGVKMPKEAVDAIPDELLETKD